MGRPKGSENKDKPFREALRRELAEVGTDQKALRKIARNLITMAGGDSKSVDGGLAAIKEIADRMDGKPAQESTVEVTTIRYVADVPAVSDTVEQWHQQHNPTLQ